MSKPVSRPPIDPELELAHTALAQQLPSGMTEAMIPMMRGDSPMDVTDETIAAHGLVRKDHTIEGFEGAPIEVSVLARADHSGTTAGILNVHPGGMVAGNRMTGLHSLLPWIVEHDAVMVTVEHRLAPEFPAPYLVEDCYAALVWMAGQAAELAIDPGRIMIVGASAGGGVAAGTALLARDRNGPRLTGQVLIGPMLDDRDRTASTEQYEGMPPWDRVSNRMGWTALLGDRRNTDDVSVYAAPARAIDLAGLPPAFIEAGSAEVFRDEDVAYASALWAAGVQAELHVWAGGFHGFYAVAPDAAISRAAVATRDAWVARHLRSR
ncbi:alpha/beta hydrolase fold domain-containing protein [Archangium primigenium]|uniref:alpha/beta hydrolase fold domain-containing protein n=1 Tax=[Archangium] primigenium TaxID=2792470 RepID=UPI00195AD61E|nr:alpha/beta hydrolase fold domain-containing protein [Archangium primigenium]MBM7114350.1 alpha/beta hydrolase fold domain-containing protein [Archangium primigenium]